MTQHSTSTLDAPTKAGLGNSLKQRQLTMMGLGSAIGAGLFLGSGEGIMMAGPAVLISYLVAGTLIILVMWALGEMAAANPNSGAFSVYAEKAAGSRPTPVHYLARPARLGADLDIHGGFHGSEPDLGEELW